MTRDSVLKDSLHPPPCAKKYFFFITITFSGAGQREKGLEIEK